MGLPAHEVVFIFLKLTHKAIGFHYSSTSTKFSLQPIFIFVFKLYANFKGSRNLHKARFELSNVYSIVQNVRFYGNAFGD